MDFDNAVDNAGDGGYGGEQQQGNNPAWNEFLEVVPQELHQKVTPLLSKWDSGVQDMVQKVHSQYEPYKQFKDKGIAAEDLQSGIQILNALQNDPENTFKAIKAYYGFDAESPAGAQGGQGQGNPNNVQDNDPYAAKMAALEQQNRTLASWALARQEAEIAQREDYNLQQEFTALEKKYGEFDGQYVASLMLTGKSAEEGVQAYQQLMEQAASKYRPKPLIMGGGGSGVHGQSIDPRKLDGKGTKNLITDMLNAAIAQEQQ